MSKKKKAEMGFPKAIDPDILEEEFGAEMGDPNFSKHYESKESTKKNEKK